MYFWWTKTEPEVALAAGNQNIQAEKIKSALTTTEFAVRGARSITRLEDAPVGNGSPGPWAERLAAALARD